MGFRMIVGSDEAGYDYKEAIKADLERDGRVDSIIDVGVVRDATAPYPAVAIEAAERVANGEADRAILICGTGLGGARLLLGRALDPLQRRAGAVHGPAGRGRRARAPARIGVARLRVRPRERVEGEGRRYLRLRGLIGWRSSSARA
jgi:hypothetical protein